MPPIAFQGAGPVVDHGLREARIRRGIRIEMLPMPRTVETALLRIAAREAEFLPQAVAEIPWGHNVILLEKLKDSAQRIWYAQQATANGSGTRGIGLGQ